MQGRVVRNSVPSFQFCCELRASRKLDSFKYLISIMTTVVL